MPTFVTHTVIGIVAGKGLADRHTPERFALLAVVCSVLPDADVLAFRFGIPYGDFFGYRGFFHSLFFALLLSLFVTSIFFRSEKILSKRRWLYLFSFFVITASHGTLDAFTNGGLGIALLSPFDNSRHFFGWTPLNVSPIGFADFLSPSGLRALSSEILWVWLPLFSITLLYRLIRKNPLKRS